jgi:hypothetical protein
MMTHALLRYLLGFLAPIVLLGIVLLLNKAALDNAGEFADISRIVAAQRADEGLYNGLVHSVQAYKYETYRQANPKIVALGSSRSLQVRDYFFNGDFYNLGGVSADPLRIFNIMDTLFAEHQPRQVVWLMDFWHFCSTPGTQRKVKRPARAIANRVHSDVERLLIPPRLMQSGHIDDPLKYLQLVLGETPVSHNGIRLYGLDAVMTTKTAFDRFGSKYSGLDGDIEPVHLRIDRGLKSFARKIHYIFGSSCVFNQENFDYVKLIDAELRAKGIALTMIAAPMMGEVIDAMRKDGRYEYVKQWRLAMQRTFSNFYDMHDIRPLGADACEFLDYFHGGEVAYMRIFSKIADDAGAALGKSIARTRLLQLSATNQGKLTVANNAIGVAFRDQLRRFNGACDS